MVKSLLDMSKKIFPRASTFILAVVLETQGNASVSDPSFAVLAASTVGYVIPPSVESDILTFGTLNGDALVPATSQVTSNWEPPT